MGSSPRQEAAAPVYGYHPVRELLRHRPQEVAKVWVGAGRGGHRRREIEQLCQRHRVPLARADERQLRILAAGGVHNGFAAELSTVAAEVEPTQRDESLILLLEDVQDPRNLGALLRVAEGAGVSRVLVRDRGSAPITPTVTKAAAGATEWLDIERVTNSARTIAGLKEQGFWIYGADASGQAPWEIDLTGPLCLCLGGEGQGLRSHTRSVCDGLIGLPMRGRVESLNVSTAAAALLYEAIRQRV